VVVVDGRWKWIRRSTLQLMVTLGSRHPIPRVTTTTTSADAASATVTTIPSPETKITATTADESRGHSCRRSRDGTAALGAASVERAAPERSQESCRKTRDEAIKTRQSPIEELFKAATSVTQILRRRLMDRSNWKSGLSQCFESGSR